MILEELLKIITLRNIKQKEICGALGISQSYASELLSGKKVFSISLLEKLCSYLNIEIILVDKYRY